MMISVVIPAYNAERTLERAIKSCLDQEYNDMEIIIVDNNSVDRTLEIARKIASSDKRITVSQSFEQGASFARNHGAEIAVGKWLQFLDADDVLLNDKWSRQLSLLKDDHSWLIGAFIYRRKEGDEYFTPVDSDPWKAIMYSGEIGCMNSNLFKRETYYKLSGMNTNLIESEDYDLYFRLMKNKEPFAVDQIPGCIYIEYYHPTLSSENDLRRTSMRVALSFRIIDHLKSNETAYWASNQKFMLSALLLHLRRQATYDLKGAKKNFKNAFPDGLSLELKDSGILPACFPLFLVFGFYPVERLRNFLRSLKEIFLSELSGG